MLKRVVLTVLKCSLTTVAVGRPVGVVGVLKGVTTVVGGKPVGLVRVLKGVTTVAGGKLVEVLTVLNGVTTTAEGKPIVVLTVLKGVTTVAGGRPLGANMPPPVTAFVSATSGPIVVTTVALVVMGEIAVTS